MTHLYQIIDGDTITPMNWDDLRKKVPGDVCDSTLQSRLNHTKVLATLVMTLEQAKAAQKAKRWRTNNRRGE